MTAPSLLPRVLYRPLLGLTLLRRLQSSPRGVRYRAGRICAAGLPHVPQRAELVRAGRFGGTAAEAELASVLPALARLALRYGLKAVPSAS